MAVHVMSLGAFIKEVGELPAQLEGAVVRGFRSAALFGVSVVQQEIQSPNPDTGTPPAVFNGDLLRSVEYQPIEKGGSIVVDAPHAAIVELGTRPHWSPLAPLVAWAMRKFSVDEKAAYAIALRVRAKIARVGTAPRFYMKRAVESAVLKQAVLREIEVELKKL